MEKSHGRHEVSLPSDGFKVEDLEMLRHSCKSAKQIKCELGISPGLLIKWRLIPKRSQSGSNSGNRSQRFGEVQNGDLQNITRTISSNEGKRFPSKRKTFLPKTAEVRFHADHEREFSVKRMCKIQR